jgi:hypothetical protein
MDEARCAVFYAVSIGRSGVKYKGRRYEKSVLSQWA